MSCQKTAGNNAAPVSEYPLKVAAQRTATFIYGILNQVKVRSKPCAKAEISIQSTI